MVALVTHRIIRAGYCLLDTLLAKHRTWVQALERNLGVFPVALEAA
jgi:hypothetical protein